MSINHQKDSSINSVKYYGEGLAPYFISLSLWIGAMIISVIISIIKKLNVFKSKLINSFIGSFIIGSAFVILQSCILSFTLINGLNINPVSIPKFCVINAFISAAFFSVMYGLSYRMTISGINQSVLNHNILVIVIFMVVFLAGGFITKTVISRGRNVKECNYPVKAA